MELIEFDWFTHYKAGGDGMGIGPLTLCIGILLRSYRAALQVGSQQHKGNETHIPNVSVPGI
jgi:hypothetical protein